ncbi:hypothetical protein [Leptospira weilii]|uniref:Uncharacterized protein n=1 Tax=Leptospira weilii str. UI 13098 TaxID=1088542 RepID=M6Q0P6_9LEPT|nr:hypothetical protein [Leptospira weilii]EMN88864.1 hypothetical protein LEP1GSC108_4118 [Leptospira weilii str. UI 13098]
MTLLSVAKFFLENPSVPLRPVHVARRLTRPEKTIYRAIQVLNQWGLIEEHEGLYILNPDTIEGKSKIKKATGTGAVYILIHLLPGKSFFSGEFRLLTGIQSLERAKRKLLQTNLILPDNDLFFSENFRWQLSPKIQTKLGQAQAYLRALRKVYGK